MSDPVVMGPAPAPGPGLSRLDRLLAELRSFGLSEVDAHRAAFAALALADHWPKARIGRYLGISRARVGQKVEKLRDYAMSHPPTLVHLLANADARPGAPTTRVDHAIAFDAKDWEDLDFSRSMCEMLE